MFTIFIFGLTRFVFLDVLSLVHIVLNRNLAVWNSICSHFCDISILFDSYLGSSGGHDLVVDPVKWATLRPRAESLQFEA